MSDSNLLIVGSVGLDTVKTPFGKVERVLGGTASYASCSSSHFSSTSIIGVVGDDFPDEHTSMLESKKIDLTCLERVTGKTFFWQGYYEGDMNEAITEDTQLGVFAEFSPKIPDSHTSIPFLFLGNIHPQLQLDVLNRMSNKPVIAADTMNFWIQGDTLPLLKDVVKGVDIMLVNDGEAALLSGKSNLLDAAEDIMKMGPRAVVIKKGSHGAMLFMDGKIFNVPAIPLRTAKDPTGAGDTFAGGMTGYLASKGTFDFNTMKQAIVAGTVMASFTVEDFSLFRLSQVEKPEIKERLTLMKELTHFDDVSV